MDVGSIREGIKTVLSDIPGVDVYATIPRTPPVLSGIGTIIIEPDSPYITWPDSGQLASSVRGIVRFIITAIAGTVDFTEAQQRVDNLISSGATSGNAQTRAIYDRLRGNQTLDGTACMVNVINAEAVLVNITDRNGVESQWPAGQIHIEVTVRTR